MIRFVRDLRLIPIAVAASACLLGLKTADLVLGRLMLGHAAPPSDASVVHLVPGVPRAGEPKRSWAQQAFNFPDSNAPPAAENIAPLVLEPLVAQAPAAADNGNAELITGSIGGKRDDGKVDPPAAEPADMSGKSDRRAVLPRGTVILGEGPPLPSPAERAILERLSERRRELDKRARELDMREGLVAAAEKRIAAQLAEIKQGQTQPGANSEQQSDAEAARFKSLVTMYQDMKPRDAAKIFDRLEIGVLIKVASQINPRRMADILAQMLPETAERLTVELANRAGSTTKDGNAELPKIEGRPATP
jgi:flagellar motility protein MotE (MotC chaperone)